MNTRESFRPTIRRLACTVLAGLLGMLLGLSVAADTAPRGTAAKDARTVEEEAAVQYVANLKRLLETAIVPKIRHGILNTAASRPPALTVEVANDPSPFNVEANIDRAGSLTVQLSSGYLTMHDAALDGVALSSALQRPQDLRRYLMYQLHLAHENHRQRARGARARPAMSFADFIGLDPTVSRAIFAQPQVLTGRNRVQVESLGWTIAHLLVQADSKLAGMPPSAATSDGAGAAHLAAASGWFPVPPVATALGLAAIERSPAATFDEGALLCRAARLMQAGIEEMRAQAPRRSQPDRDAGLEKRVGEIRSQIASMRRDGGCVAEGSAAATQSKRIANHRNRRETHR